MSKIQVGLAKDVAPGAMRGFKAGDRGILISNIDGKFHAIGNKCTHRGCSLSMGRLEGEVVTCPCHGSRFNLKTGAVVRGPAEEPEPAYSVAIEDDGIWVEV
jgi:nitrite reductase/ring-hydroxylating ferredoxin subunit